MKEKLGSISLLLTALIWGTAFVAQSVGLKNIGPFTFNAIRLTIGSISLIPIILIFKDSNEEYYYRTNLIKGGIICGIILGCATSTQQYGLLYTTPGKAGFLSAMYILIVPFLAFVIYKKRVKLPLFIAVVVAIIGMYFLCIKESLTINIGDIIVFSSSVMYAAHIIAVDKYSKLCNCIKLSSLQFLIGGILCSLGMLFFETPDIASIKATWFPLLYTGAISCGIAYTFQIIGQKNTNPTLASMLMSLESVFAALSEVVFLHGKMTPNEIIGMILMFSAITLAQILG